MCFWLTLTAPSIPEQLLLPEKATALADGWTDFFNFTLTHSWIMPHQTLHGLDISYNSIAVPVEFAPWTAVRPGLRWQTHQRIDTSVPLSLRLPYCLAINGTMLLYLHHTFSSAICNFSPPLHASTSSASCTTLCIQVSLSLSAFRTVWPYYYRNYVNASYPSFHHLIMYKLVEIV